MRRYTRPPAIPRSTPMMSATQSLTSALRLNVGCISSMAPPNATRANEDRQQAKAARAGQWEGQCGEGNEVDNFVAARRRWRWLVQGPEHRDRERKEDDECQGNVEVLAHGAGVYCTPSAMANGG